MAFDYSKLSGRIKEIYGSQVAFSRVIGKTNVYVSRVMTGKSFLDQRGIERWADALGIESSDISVYFFNRKVCEK